MIIKFSPVRLSIIILLVILFPLVQKQWLNLYLYDINNFTIYKILYYLSGLVVPILIIINSLNKFTYYKFDHRKFINNTNDINGKLLFFVTSLILIILSFLISHYIFLNIKIFFNLLNSHSKQFALFDIDKQILILAIISILLIFKKTKLLMKKIILINFFIISIMIWYFQINNIFLNDLISIDILKFKDKNLINIIYLMSIESIFYLWSYFSYSSYLSDWSVPKLHFKDVTPIFNILMFYLFIILYYSILSK